MGHNINIDPENIELRTILEMGGPLTGKRMLEIGCGDGRLTKRYAAYAQEVIAIDPNQERVTRAIAQNRHPHVTFLAADLLDFEASAPFDAALLSWAL